MNKRASAIFYTLAGLAVLFLMTGVAVTVSGAATSRQVTGSVQAVAAPVSSGGYVAVTPLRVFDTRIGVGWSFIDGRARPKPGEGERMSVFVATGDFAPGAVSALAVNITMTNPDAAGFVTAWSGTGAMPGTSVLNVTGPGDTDANFVIVPVFWSPAQQRVGIAILTLYTLHPADLIVDVMGYVV